MSMLRRVCALLVLFAGVVCAQGAGQQSVSLIVTGGTVVTMDVGGRVLAPGAVAIDGRDIVAVDTPSAIAQRFTAAPDHRRHGHGRHARAHQYAHPCADGALSRAGRRPRADGLAPEIHLSRRSKDGKPGVRPRRYAPGCPRNDSVGDHGLRRHVLLRGRDRQGDQGSRDSRRPGSDDHPVPGT